ncbi:MAG: hypothetical protein QNJ60_00390 [Xenococcaceae cyanobacterium MO_188.B19]|nr:hypothetical protein [Xenococcaceae cyanobacterium MO_188.B19]
MMLTRPIQKIHQYRIWIGLLLIVAILIIVIQPVLSADTEILNITIEGMNKTQAWWDEMWKSTFDPTYDPEGVGANAGTNISVYSFVNPVRFLMGVGIIFWIFDYGKKMVNSNGIAHNVQVFSESFLPVVLILIFMANQALYSRVLAYGLRDIVNSWTEGVVEQQIAGVQLRSALEEQLLVEEVKDQIRWQANKCLQMPRPEVVLPSADRPTTNPDNPLTTEQEQAYSYLECLDKLVAFMEQKQQEAEVSKACRWGCKFFKGWISYRMWELSLVVGKEKAQRIFGYETKPVTEEAVEDNYHSMVDFFKNFERKGWMAIFSFTQWMWMSFLEMSMWLLGLFAPIFVVLALIPGKQNMFYFWLIEFLTIGLAKLAYVALVGVVAVQLSQVGTVIMAQDDRFLMALGAFAPGVSFAVVTAGGIAAASSFRSQSVGMINTAAGIATGSIATVIYSMSRYADKKR